MPRILARESGHQETRAPLFTLASAPIVTEKVVVEGAPEVAHTVPETYANDSADWIAQQSNGPDEASVAKVPPADIRNNTDQPDMAEARPTNGHTPALQAESRRLEASSAATTTILSSSASNEAGSDARSARRAAVRSKLEKRVKELRAAVVSNHLFLKLQRLLVDDVIERGGADPSVIRLEEAQEDIACDVIRERLNLSPDKVLAVFDSNDEPLPPPSAKRPWNVEAAKELQEEKLPEELRGVAKKMLDKAAEYFPRRPH